MEIESVGKIGLRESVARLAAATDTGNAVDGGAGSGSTAKEILQELSPQRRVIAYEPFPGNHQFWNLQDPRIELRTLALGSEKLKMTLRVSEVVQPDSDWGRKGKAGYSSLGFLTAGEPQGPFDSIVQVTRGDDDLAEDGPIGILKLDLQGGEAAALSGMRDLLESQVNLCWIEMLKGNSGLIDVLQDSGFRVFDTEYLFKGEPSAQALKHFEPTSGVFRLSTGASAWHGVPRKRWRNFAEEIISYGTEFGLVQTDLLCVSRRFTDLFNDILRS